MFFWYIGPSIVGVYEVFRSSGLDYRLIALGALAPLLVDLPAGHMGPGHSIVVAVGVLALVMVGTIGRPRLLRRRLVCIPIGWFCGLVLSGAFLHDTVFLWPLLGTDTGDVGLLPPLTLLVLGEAAGFAVCAWSAGRFGLGQPARRAAFVREGRLTELAPPAAPMILLVRHGETEANRARLALGRADPPLTTHGRAQAAALAACLGDSGAARVLSSPLQRAVATATAIADVLGVAVELEPRLVEMDYGEWDERSFSEFPPEDLARWRTDATFAPPGGESLLEVGTRVATLCDELVDGPPVVAVSHVSPIKAAALWAMDADPLLAWRMHLDVASVTRVGAPGGRRCLVGFNDTAHLR